MIDLKEEENVSKETAEKYLKEIVEKISERFTKKYLSIQDAEENFIQTVEFFEPQNKKPVPPQKVKITFKFNKKLHDEDLLFQIENESVFYPFYESINLNYFETLLDRVVNNKNQSSKALLLQTNFESTRMLNLVGENLKLYTIDEEEDILSNNKSEYFHTDFKFKQLDIKEIDKLIKLLWKTLTNNNTEDLNLNSFKLLFTYGKLNFAKAHYEKLWKYTDKDRNGRISYQEFVTFSIDLIQCLKAFFIAKYKSENNEYIKNKIKSCVEIMNMHFKEYDHEDNQEISFDNLKKCLAKENELFSRKEIEIILKQINPIKNFEYWKFDKILKILYIDNFNFTQLMKEDKIYKYLIKIFSAQDVDQSDMLHNRKMKYAFLIEDKLKLNKTQIKIILNFFNISEIPEIKYYKASLIIRDIIEELFSADMPMQKIDITSPAYNNYIPFEDEYDIHMKNIKELFVQFDRDFDHLLNKEEFKEFMIWLIPYLNDEDFNEIFETVDVKKNQTISYPIFKEKFGSLMQMTRIRNIMKEISNIL